MDRKKFLKSLGAVTLGGVTAAGLPLSSIAQKRNMSDHMFFDISLAQWSLNRSYFGPSREVGKGEIDPLYFARHARQRYDIGAIEYVNQFYFGKAEDQQYLNELKNVADNEGVESVLIMCDGEGNLGDPDSADRQQAVENHYKWVNMASFLGCHAIRVNAASQGTYEEQMERAADGLRSLTEYADDEGISVVVENHGGLSSNADWLVGTIEMVDHPNCGTLPDFGNFRISEDEMYDYYEGTEKLMEHAKGVSAKTYDFDEEGNETTLDVMRLMRIVKDAGYTGYVGIEYEGNRLSEDEGIKATKALLEKVGAELTD
ncbi:sugar phosphate isomerase/epimerase family protein [Rhodohalobacter sulfatireducens]|uniref:Sugar phosphate isomerase/epimerase n=1 Tax=Rhodohalobacter sulfatireducens TaxID=2911366 RepID=A0ABS9KCW4_9BACT|nr:sugar phosphate isomerase/epimerase family protein [Rhodohalobacter sulfatireducens]MCG2588700.1 sugar phosphate isomerase/epimerase [Rhodohalobacter sulfatireducens]